MKRSRRTRLEVQAMTVRPGAPAFHTVSAIHLSHYGRQFNDVAAGHQDEGLHAHHSTMIRPGAPAPPGCPKAPPPPPPPG
jgi:hypothetical protein